VYSYIYKKYYKKKARIHLFENVLVRGRRRARDRLLASDRQTVVVDLRLIRLGELVRARWQRLIDLPLLLFGLYAVAAAVAGTPRLQHLGEPKLERRQFDGFPLAVLVACRKQKGLLVGKGECFI